MYKKKFNSGWMFTEGGGSALAALGGDGQPPVEVTLPHDASVGRERNPEEPNGSGNGYFREENYTYTKKFSMERADEGRNVYLEFEGVYQNASVYVNNAYAGKCPYGYSNFYVDITKYLSFDEPNVVKVIVKNGVPSGRWYTGGGIYRDVNLMVADRLHLAADGVHLATVEAENGQAVVRVRSTVAYTGTGVRDVALNVELRDAEGNVVAGDVMPLTVEEQSEKKYQQRLYVQNAHLWDAEHPYLYTYSARLMEGGQTIDEERGTFGIRRLQLDPGHGLRVNGKTVKLRGGCIHHDNGVIGAAEFAHAAEDRVRRLKEAGYNALRSSHYPMSRQLLNACDKYGMYVMDEFADVWTTTKVDFDYGIHMTEWWEHEVTNLVKKDYNHPSVIMYSIGNEIPEIGNKFDAQWGKKLADKFRLLDDSRYVTNSMNLLLAIMDKLPKLMAMQASQAAAEPAADMAGTEEIQKVAGKTPASSEADKPQEINSMMNNMGAMMAQLMASDFAADMVKEACAQVDITGYNYAASRYEKDGELFPNRILVGSETNPPDLDTNWELVERLPYVIGDFSWTSWDYLGEAGIGKVTYGQPQGMGFYAPYPCKAAYCGDINIIGNRRPTSYWREIIWGLRSQPYLCVQPPQYHDVFHGMTQWVMTDAVRSWNWKGYEGSPVKVEVYTDAEEAELFVNGVSVERKAVGGEKKAIAYFETVYKPGKIEVIVYRGGVEAGRDVILTASDEVIISAVADCEHIPADGSDIAYVELCMQDENGICNSAADRAVTIGIEGPGILLGFGSADPESAENFFDTTARAFEGRLRAVVRGNGKPGTITVTASAEGCEDVKVQIEACDN